MARLEPQINLTGILLFLAFIAMSQPLLGSTAIISDINIAPTGEGDRLLITHEGNIDALSLVIDKEKHAILKIIGSAIAPSFKLKQHSGKLIRHLKLETTSPAHTNIIIDFKRRLGRHTRKEFSKDGKNFVEFMLLDAVTEKPLPPTDMSVIQPAVEKGVFELNGTKKKMPLDHSRGGRNVVSTEEFLSLFGTAVKPRPNRITNVSYHLSRELLELTLSLHQRPKFTLKTRNNPPGIEFRLTKVLGDFEINEGSILGGFLGKIVTTRNNANTLVMKANLYETAEVSSNTIENPHKAGYLLTIKVKRIYPWETEAAIPAIDIR